jgi:hypothetical protein
MTPVNDIVTAIENRLGVVTTHTKLPYVYDVSKNNWNLSQDGYGVRPAQTTETDSVSKRLTYIQSFEVVLTKGYIHSSVEDSSLQSAIIQISDLMHSVFVDLEQTRLGIPEIVLNLTDFIIEEPVILGEEKVVSLTGTVSILYRLTV